MVGLAEIMFDLLLVKNNNQLYVALIGLVS